MFGRLLADALNPRNRGPTAITPDKIAKWLTDRILDKKKKKE